MVDCTTVRRIVVIMLGLACMCSCSIKRHLARAEARVEGMYAETKDWDKLPIRSITWQQAVSLLMKHNPSVLEVEDQIRQAERESLSVYTEMVPGLSYYGYITRSLSELTGAVNSDELSHARAYASALPCVLRQDTHHSRHQGPGRKMQGGDITSLQAGSREGD